ncbi:UDP-N-acetylglucosamine 1-carboxyvinyltransferase [Bartonella sp. TP]|uniref:UDP-N-acetylglucosamine 1-carboxyvinyltransferase n=1 Tax=Bartonella sp. TP TaxID=3057550 RepID=UPI0025AF8DCD|nr:UDP-N-acetylglucosamine 1-carboxyvinyltransferase [Bartonella sp. TP]MDN5249253.1 UDP-N-acetylglucosamine 1-carboxyvinyltransferase [Alphaproteobacteria bacterium]WJW79660.1 UDP-N-acetylglucosamine 1-carboxyvinyltransferase [Bartonella sp. TP]
MDRIKIVGGNSLNGTIKISGAKNAALPLMIASLLTAEDLCLENVPYLADIEQLIRILANLGVDYTIEGRKGELDEYYRRVVHFSAKNIATTRAPYELVSKMRASFWVIAPLLARSGEACVSLPGGCAIGTRPVDFILNGLRALGADIKIEAGYAHAQAPKGLIGAKYKFPKATVGGTHVMLMAASLAKGETILENAAKEPEVTNLCECLIAMGAKINGVGTETLTIQGQSTLHGARQAVIFDRIEAGTYAIAAAMTGGSVLLEGAHTDLLNAVLESLSACGVKFEQQERGLLVSRYAKEIEPVDIITRPYPGFPTDLQAQFMALMTKADGISRVTETIFENRFMHVQELARLGASISLAGQTAIVQGVKKLKGAQVMATDLRASVSLVIAGLVAEGETIVNRVYHLDRGFENLEEKLSNCGAQIERIRGA